ncbi:hypothetical protein AHAS_Ahas10G0186000 [Arachis hypogaea]
MGKIPMFLVGIILIVLGMAAEAEYLKYKDPKQPLNVRIKDLMSRMTLQEKIGQMTQIDRTVASADVINNVLSGGGSVPKKEASAEDWINMVNDFQKGALSTRLGIPMIYGIDAVHGHNNVYKATIFPHNKIGEATALEVRATGIPYVFAPCIAVCRDPRWGRCYESYSEDHSVVQAMTQIIPGLQGQIPTNSRKGVPFVAGKKKVAACAKHYVGDGGTTEGINENNTVINRHGLLSIHMPGYYNSIINGVSTVMISYSSWNGIKMHANRDLITGFLKNTLRFRGFVISDWQGIDRITSPPHANYTYSIVTGINAGIDMIMVPFNYTEFIDGLTSLVKHNFIPTSRIDDAVVYKENPDLEYVKSNDFSYAIVVVGEHPYAETFGDSLNLTIPDPGPKTITNVCGGVKCVVVVISGRPVVIQPYLDTIEALVAAWLPGTEGQGVADVLFGDYGFTGKLPRTWFKTVDQLPMNVGDSHYDPLYPFGFGLTTKPNKVE